MKINLTLVTRTAKVTTQVLIITLKLQATRNTAGNRMTETIMRTGDQLKIQKRRLQVPAIAMDTILVRLYTIY